MKSHKRIKQRGPFLSWPTGTPPADSRDLVAWLRIRPTVQPHLQVRFPDRCAVCGTAIAVGDTAWDPVQQLHVHKHFCHRCGVLLALHSNAWTTQELHEIPAIGGPPRHLTSHVSYHTTYDLGRQNGTSRMPQDQRSPTSGP